MKRYILFTISLFLLSIHGACQFPNKSSNDIKENSQKQELAVEVKNDDGFSRAYFASGCFWCVEAVYESVKGVKESISGYSGGHTQNPTYASSNTGRTGHAEAVEIIYDASIVSFSDLLDVYFGSQNVTQTNGQGPDKGSQYRSIIFYQNESEEKLIIAKVVEQEKIYGKGNVAAQILPFQKFWKGEAYHQNFEKRNPTHGYIRNVSLPRLKRFQAKFPELLKSSNKH